MASKPINIRWIRTGFQPYRKKIMFSIVLQTIFHLYQNKNHKIYTSFINQGLQFLGTNKKTDFILMIFYFNIHEELSVIRCDEKLFHI